MHWKYPLPKSWNLNADFEPNQNLIDPIDEETGRTCGHVHLVLYDIDFFILFSSIHLVGFLNIDEKSVLHTYIMKKKRESDEKQRFGNLPIFFFRNIPARPRVRAFSIGQLELGRDAAK